MATEFTPYAGFFGGLLIGLSAVLFMLFNGRVAGVTGITGGILEPVKGDIAWRIIFLVSAMAAPALYSFFTNVEVDIQITSDIRLLVAGGLLVGFGACMASGCTSGHGVCGLGRLSKRSLVVTLTFMATAFLTVYLLQHVFAGWL